MGKILKNGISYAGGGAEGKSAYQTWLDLGNTGTEQDFLDSLGGSASIDDNDVSLDSTWSSAKIVTEISDNYAIFEGVIGDSYYSTTIDEEEITSAPSSLYGGWTLDKVNTNFTEASILSTFYNATSKKAISLTEDVRIGEVYTDSFSVYDDTMNNGGNPYKVALLWNNNSTGGGENTKTYTSLAELGLTADVALEDVVNALKNGESFLAPVNTFTNYETIFPNKLPNDQWNKIHIIKGTSLGNSHIRCFSQSGACEYLANVNNTNIVSWNDVSGTYIDISDAVIEKLGNEILKYPVGKYRINSTTTGNKFTDLPSDAETKCGLIEVNGTAVGKSPFTDTWVYRMYKFECLTGSLIYTRRLNSGATAGQIEADTGWCAQQNIYTSLEELGLTAPTTVGEVFMAMPEKSMLMLNVEALVDDDANVLTVTDVPKEYGVLTIEKHIYGRFRIEYSNSLGGAVFNARKWIGALKGSDGTGLVWKEVNTGNHKYTTMAELGLDGATATIQDVMDKVAVGDSVMIRTDAFNNNNWQTQCNNIQYGYLKIEKTQNSLSNIELQEVITPNRRYFGIQSRGKFAGWVATTQTITSLAELGLTADVTFQDVVDALPKGGSALLGVKDFANYQTIFPYEDGNDQFARVHIVKGVADGSSMYARWFRKDGVKEAIAIFNINDNKFDGWQEIVTENKITNVLTNTSKTDEVPNANLVANEIHGKYFDIADYNNAMAMPIGKWRVDSNNKASQMQNLPVPKAGILEVKYLQGNDGNTVYTSTFKYAMLTYTAITGEKYERSFNSDDTVGHIVNDTGWKEIASKSYVDSKHKYSTSEVAIGTWIDGKTIYRKTFTKSPTSNQATGNTVTIDVATISGLTNVINIQATAKLQNYNNTSAPIYAKIPFGEMWRSNSGSSGTYVDSVYVEGTALKIHANNCMPEDIYYVTVEYTK